MARKASLSLMLGWFVVAIAGLAVAGFGFGIAQAGGNHSESPVLSLEGLEALEALEQAGGNHTEAPVLSFKDMEALEHGSSSSPSARVLPSAVDLDYAADGTPSPDVAHVRGAVEAGRLPSEGNADSSIVETVEDMYRGWGHDQWGL